MIFQHSRFQIWNKSQHPYSHSLSDFQYSNPALPGITDTESALNYIIAVLYPQSKTNVATPAALPLVGNALNDMRVVDNDGDGKAAAYRWEKREGEAAASWHKIYDIDWGVDSILQGFLLKTQDIYVKQWGYDDLDATGTPVGGLLAGQSIYGGASPNANLTLFANSGDGLGPNTGYVQVGDSLRPTTNAQRSLGTTTERWLKLWAVEAQVGTMNIQGGLIRDTLGTISFDDENLTTAGSGTFGTLAIASGSITDSSGGISFSNENLTTTGDFTSNKVTAIGAASSFATGTTIGDFTVANGSLTSLSAAINFGTNNLTTTGSISGGAITGSSVTGGNLRLSGNTLLSTDASGNITLDPDGTGTVSILAAMTTLGQTVTGTVGITGQLNIDNLRLDGSTLSVTAANTDLTVAANGTGRVRALLGFHPVANSTGSLGSASVKYSGVFSDAISDGTNTMSTSVLMTLRDITSGAVGSSLFWNGTDWLPSIPDTEIDHGVVAGLLDDDHTQYALLSGRSGSQTLNGGTISGGNLILQSTAHVTKGVIATDSVVRPTANGTLDFGATSFNWRDLYLTGQLLGARLQNATTAGQPTASAGTKGRMYYNTDLEDVFVDRGGTWKKLSLEKYVNQDAVGWTGAVSIVTYTVSSEVSDARECVWTFSDNSNAFEQLAVEITKTQTQVTVTAGLNLPAGTYT